MLKITHAGDAEYGRPPQMAEDDRRLLHYAVANYGHVLNTPEDRNRTRTWLHFADKIAASYSLEVERNGATVSLLRRLGKSYPLGPAHYTADDIQGYIHRAWEQVHATRGARIYWDTARQQETRRALDFLARTGAPKEGVSFVSSEPDKHKRICTFLEARLSFCSVTFERGSTQWGDARYLTVHQGNNTLRMVYEEGQYSSQALIGYIEAQPTGAGTGTRVFDALRQYADITGVSLCVFKVTNHAFFKRFPWFTVDDLEATYNPHERAN